MTQVTVDDMKKGIKENPEARKYLEKGIKEYGLSEEEALDTMICVWLSQSKDNLVDQLISKYNR